jgi:hypothetical protein
MLLKGFKEEILQLSWTQRAFILCAMICGFCITADYGIVRPVSNSLFITDHGSEFFSYAWLAIVPLNFLIVELYNRFLARLGILRMLFNSELILRCFHGQTPIFIVFLLYLERDLRDAALPAALVCHPFDITDEAGKIYLRSIICGRRSRRDIRQQLAQLLRCQNGFS